MLLLKNNTWNTVESRCSDHLGTWNKYFTILGWSFCPLYNILMHFYKRTHVRGTLFCGLQATSKASLWLFCWWTFYQIWWSSNVDLPRAPLSVDVDLNWKDKVNPQLETEQGHELSTYHLLSNSHFYHSCRYSIKFMQPRRHQTLSNTSDRGAKGSGSLGDHKINDWESWLVFRGSLRRAHKKLLISLTTEHSTMRSRPTANQFLASTPSHWDARRVLVPPRLKFEGELLRLS